MSDPLDPLSTLGLRTLTVEQLALKTNIPETRILSMASEGTFPRPFRMVNGLHVWLTHEIDSWVMMKSGDRIDPKRVTGKRRPKRPANTGYAVKPVTRGAPELVDADVFWARRFHQDNQKPLTK